MKSRIPREAAAAEDADGQDRNQQTADQQTHAVYKYQIPQLPLRPLKIA